MEKIVFSLALLFYFQICNCQPDKIDALSSPKTSINNLSDIATDVEYIPLETSPNSIMGRIINLKVRNNFIYVATVDNKIFCFNSSGKYLFNLAKAGRGPEEYTYCSTFDVNESNSILAVLGTKEIVLYNQVSNGFTFLKRINLNESPQLINFTGQNDNILLQYSNTNGTNPISKELINIKGETLLSWPNFMKFQIQEKMMVLSRYENTSFNFKNDLYLKEVGNDTIFKFNGNKLDPVLIFDTKNKRVSPEVRANPKYYADHMYEYYILQKFFGSERFIYYTAAFNKDYNIVGIYDQVKKTRYAVPGKEFLKDDISGGVNFEPQYCNNGTFYSWADAITFKNYSTSEIFVKAKVRNSAKHESLKNLAQKITENDNPIIIAAKIR
jgi:hypothetical protein